MTKVQYVPFSYEHIYIKIFQRVFSKILFLIPKNLQSSNGYMIYGILTNFGTGMHYIVIMALKYILFANFHLKQNLLCVTEHKKQLTIQEQIIVQSSET